MTTEPPTQASRVCWVVTDGRAGIEAQALGLAEAMARSIRLTCVPKRITIRAPWRSLPAMFWGDALGKLAADSDELAPPYPDIVVGCGRLSVPVCLSLKQKGVFAVQLQNPRWRTADFDVVVAPRHDGLAGENVVSILGSANRMSAERLAQEANELSHAAPFDDAGGDGPRIAVLIGGASKAYRFGAHEARRIAGALAELAETGARLAITFSRRTSPEAAAQIRERLAGANAWIWDGAPVGSLANPYPGLLGWADHILATADSTNMLCEAASAGKPLHILTLSGGAPKFRRLHDDLIAYGAARIFSGELENWSYMPLNETERAAEEVLRRFGAARPGL
ncbi:MAG: mitochondrial fission ELM1 family protein [Pseudomonadota bacterium]